MQTQKGNYLLGLVRIVQVTLIFTHPVFAEDQEDILKVYGSEEMISLATGYTQPLSQAPATATVITEKEIHAMGAATLDQVLETVPGLHVSTARAVTSIPIVRGIFSETNSGLLVLVNGIPIDRGLTGTFSAFHDVLVENIARIEIIRGPGSTLYGADAFSGVINIITKTAHEINGTEVGTRIASFDTYDGWFLYGGKSRGVDVAFALLGRTSGGYDKTIAADAQTRLDTLVGTQASLAPSSINTDRDLINANLDLSSGPWRVRAGIQKRSTGTGTGFLNALDPEGRFNPNRITVDALYHNSFDNVEVNGTVSYLQADTDTHLTLLPPGTLGLFPTGVRNDVAFTERQVLTEFSTLYSGIPNHWLRAGTGFYSQTLEDVTDQRNFLIGPNGKLIPTGVFTTTAKLGVPAAQPESDRTVYYGFIQDEWSLAPDWSLTAGLRLDHFSDTGIAVDPRLALVWNTTLNSTVKLLYGHAFRSPSFLEQFSRNNLVAQGNPDLVPEAINTAELSIDYNSPTFRSNLTLFRYWITDRIGIIPNPQAPLSLMFSNTGNQTGYGLEAELSWKVTTDLTLKGNYSYQQAEADNATNLSLAPKHRVYAEVNWRLMPNWHLNINVNSVLDRERAPPDPRPNVKDYTLVNLFLERKAIAGHLDAGFGIRNLFDVDAREPSVSQSLPYDIPLPGRTFFGEISLRF